MSKTARTTIKTWFETGDYPTQEQFWNWLDSFWHLDDAIPTSSVTGLDALLAAKATTEETDNLQTQINEINNGPLTQTYNANASYSIPDGKLLEKIVVIPSGTLDNFGIGETNGGYEIVPGLPIEGGNADLIEVNIYSNGGKTIWFNGITAQTTIKIYLR